MLNLTELRKRHISLNGWLSETEVLRVLDIALAAEKLNAAAQKIHDEIYPREIFIGCDDCVNETCDCDRGVQISRQLADAIDVYSKVTSDALNK